MFFRALYGALTSRKYKIENILGYQYPNYMLYLGIDNLIDRLSILYFLNGSATYVKIYIYSKSVFVAEKYIRSNMSKNMVNFGMNHFRILLMLLFIFLFNTRPFHDVVHPNTTSVGTILILL